MKHEKIKTLLEWVVSLLVTLYGIAMFISFLTLVHHIGAETILCVVLWCAILCGIVWMVHCLLYK